MVVGAFPAAKLGALLLKQISKPIANAVKEQAKTSPVFRKYICLPPAQFYNWCEEKGKMWVLNLGKPVSVPIYNEKMAMELGANLLGEGIIFFIAAGIVIAEYSRSARKEAAKEEEKKKEMEALQMTLKELFIQTEEQAAYIRELRRKVGEIDTKLGQKSSATNTKRDDYPPPASPPLVKNADKNSEIIKNFEKESSDLPLNLSLAQEPSQWSNVLLHAVREIENEFWNYSHTEKRPGILNNALNHLCENVYKADVTTCT